MFYMQYGCLRGVGLHDEGYMLLNMCAYLHYPMMRTTEAMQLAVRYSDSSYQYVVGCSE